jgi:hypothetical protein
LCYETDTGDWFLFNGTAWVDYPTLTMAANLDIALSALRDAIAGSGAGTKTLADLNTNLASILAKVIAAPATEAKQDTLIAKDFATQTTLAALLAKVIAAPATEAKQDALAVLLGAVDAAAVIDPTASGSEIALLKGIIKQLQGDGTAGKAAPVSVVESLANRDAGVLHRNAIVAIDKVPTITITAADQTGVVGVMAAVSHGVAVAPGNAYGTAGTSAIVTITPTVNKTVDITIPQATGAEYYDIFFSAAPTGPLWLARVTETQRAAGCAVTAVATVGSGGSAGIVNVRLVGTGLANTNAIFAQNNAYTPAAAGITPINTTGKNKAYIYVNLALTDLRSAPALNILPFLKNQISTEYFQGQAQAIYLLTTIGQSKMQVFEVDLDGTTGLVVLIGTLSGQGASVTIHVELV